MQVSMQLHINHLVTLSLACAAYCFSKTMSIMLMSFGGRQAILDIDPDAAFAGVRGSRAIMADT